MATKLPTAKNAEQAALLAEMMGALANRTDASVARAANRESAIRARSSRAIRINRLDA